MAYKDPEAAKKYAYEYWRANKESESQRIREWRIANKDRIKAQSKAYSEANKEKIAEQKRAYYAANKDRLNAKSSEYNRENRDVLRQKRVEWAAKTPGRLAAYIRKYQASKLQRTPVWLSDDDKWLIEQAYELAALRTKMFGFSWHVDHIIPLQGKTVSGLHVPTNLQVIPGVENFRKNNRFEVGYAESL